MASEDLTKARSAFKITCEDPPNIKAIDIDAFFDTVDLALKENSSPNVQAVKVWIVRHLLDSPSRIVALGDFFVALSESLAKKAKDAIDLKEQQKSKRQQLFILYLANDLFHHSNARHAIRASEKAPLLSDFGLTIALQPYMGRLFALTHTTDAHLQSKHLTAIDRLLKCWKTPAYFDVDFCASLRDAAATGTQSQALLAPLFKFPRTHGNRGSCRPVELPVTDLNSQFRVADPRAHPANIKVLDLPACADKDRGHTVITVSQWDRDLHSDSNLDGFVQIEQVNSSVNDVAHATTFAKDAHKAHMTAVGTGREFIDGQMNQLRQDREAEGQEGYRHGRHSMKYLRLDSRGSYGRSRSRSTSPWDGRRDRTGFRSRSPRRPESRHESHPGSRPGSSHGRGSSRGRDWRQGGTFDRHHPPNRLPPPSRSGGEGWQTMTTPTGQVMSPGYSGRAQPPPPPPQLPANAYPRDFPRDHNGLPIPPPPPYHQGPWPPRVPLPSPGALPPHQAGHGGQGYFSSRDNEQLRPSPDMQRGGGNRGRGGRGGRGYGNRQPWM